MPSQSIYREVPKPEWNWIDEDTQARILMEIPKKHRPFIYFMIRYGVRPGEARALFWEDIDFKQKVITIRRNFSLNEHRKITKTRRIRKLPLFSDIEEILKTLPRAINS
ncbi:MAG: hypothetical protein DRG25_03785 [Deltaproteobacteria bacterium]|nr:MAG: hypothetical protein DRG25_03785 [Deltaproteobacteria bacterium]